MFLLLYKAENNQANPITIDTIDRNIKNGVPNDIIGKISVNRMSTSPFSSF